MYPERTVENVTTSTRKTKCLSYTGIPLSSLLNTAGTNRWLLFFLIRRTIKKAVAQSKTCAFFHLFNCHAEVRN